MAPELRGELKSNLHTS